MTMVVHFLLSNVAQITARDLPHLYTMFEYRVDTPAFQLREEEPPGLPYGHDFSDKY